jgi:type IV pilus assembly protein PilN
VRLNINLASKPYQDVSRVVRQWMPVLLLLAALTAGLFWNAASNWRQGREVNARIAMIDAEIAALDRQHDEALRMLRAPENVPVLSTSKFLNGLIARKSFSWTRVFMQLEQIMPTNLHVVSISPELQPATNTVQVHLSVAGTSRDAAVELVKRLEQSPSFREARIVEEAQAAPSKDNPNGDTVQFHLTAVYVPQPAHEARMVAARATQTPSAEAEPSGNETKSAGGAR